MGEDKVNKWLTLGANIGVLVGIMFLAVELRQNNDIARADVRNSITQSIYTLLQMQRDPRHIAALERQGTDAEQSFEDSILLSTFVSAYFLHVENSYYQHQFGVYDDDQYAAEVAQLNLALMNPYYAEH